MNAGELGYWQMHFFQPHIGLPIGRVTEAWAGIPGPMTKNEAEQLVAAATQRYVPVLLDPPAGADPNMAETIWLTGPLGPPVIYLPPWAKRPGVVLHEAAHVIVQGLTGAHGHDEPFGTVFGQLLARFGVADKDFLDATMAAARDAVAKKEKSKWHSYGLIGLTR